MKKTLQNLGLILVSTLLILGLLEVGVRYLKSNLGRYPKKDPVLHHALVPNAVLERIKDEFAVTYRINSLGLRNEEFEVKKPKDTFRILMLGDSYTFGIGVELEETFAKQLEKTLVERHPEKNIQIINAGVSSYSPIIHYLFLMNQGLKYDPDLVILNYDISDVQDDYKYSKIAEFDETGKPLKVNPIEVQFYYREIKKGIASKIPLLEKSELHQFIMERVYQLLGKRDVPHYYEVAQVIAGDIEYDRDLPMRENAGDWREHFERSAGYLELIHELLKEKGIGFAIASYPYGTLISEKEWKIGRRLRGFDAKVYETPLFAYLEAFCAEQGIPFLNMTPAFLATEEFPLYYPYDGHFTPAGHAIAGRALAGFVEEKKLLREWGKSSEQSSQVATP